MLFYLKVISSATSHGKSPTPPFWGRESKKTLGTCTDLHRKTQTILSLCNEVFCLWSLFLSEKEQDACGADDRMYWDGYKSVLNIFLLLLKACGVFLASLISKLIRFYLTDSCPVLSHSKYFYLTCHVMVKYNRVSFCTNAHWIHWAQQVI